MSWMNQFVISIIHVSIVKEKTKKKAERLKDICCKVVMFHKSETNDLCFILLGDASTIKLKLTPMLFFFKSKHSLLISM